METKTATIWIKDSVRKKMIKINGNRQSHDNKRLHPVLFPTSFSYQEWYKKMEDHVDDTTFHFLPCLQIAVFYKGHC
jgi:hypothetical protein